MSSRVWPSTFTNRSFRSVITWSPSTKARGRGADAMAAKDLDEAANRGGYAELVKLMAAMRGS